MKMTLVKTSRAWNANESSDDENRSDRGDDEMVYFFKSLLNETQAYLFLQHNLDRIINGQLSARRPIYISSVSTKNKMPNEIQIRGNWIYHYT